MITKEKDGIKKVVNITNKFKVGDKVRITKRNLGSNNRGKNDVCWNDVMNHYDGCVTEISYVHCKKGRYQAKDCNMWFWDEDWLDLINDNVINIADQIISHLDNGMTVVVKAKSSGYDVIYPEEFDEEEYKSIIDPANTIEDAKEEKSFVGWNNSDIRSFSYIEIVEFYPYNLLEEIKIPKDYFETFTFKIEDEEMDYSKQLAMYGSLIMSDGKTINPERLYINNNKKPMNLINKIKEAVKSKEEKRLDKYCRNEDGNYNADGISIILETLMENKELAKAIDEKLIKIEKSEDTK